MMPGVFRRARHLGRLAVIYGVGTAIDDPREFGRLARETVTGRTRTRMTTWDDRDLAAPDLGERMTRRLSRSGRASSDLRDQVVGTVTEWVSGTIGHGAATARLTAIGGSVGAGDATSGWLFEASRLAASAGLFAGSHPLLQSGYDQVLERAHRRAGYAGRLRGVLVELHRRRVDAAVDRWTELLAERLPRGLSGVAGSALDTVLSAITDRPLPPSRQGIASSDAWRGSIGGRRIAVVGPAASRDLSDSYDLRAGVANLSRLGSGKADLPSEELVYLNDETWRTHPRAETLAAIEPYEWLVLKSATADPPPRSRTLSWGANLLFSAGTPNLIPLMCFDLLVGDAGGLFLTGMDFYASSQPPAAPAADHPPMRESARIASHNPIENRAFIADLLESPRISSDPVVQEIAGLDDLAYLRRLDERFGAPRR